MVQRLGRHALSAKGLGWIPGKELRNYVAHQLHSVATKKKKKKKEYYAHVWKYIGSRIKLECLNFIKTN